MRSGYRTVVTWPQRSEGERAAYNLARVRSSWLGEGDRRRGWELENPLRFAHVNLRDGFIAAGLKLAVLPEHRLFRRRRQERAPGRDFGARRRGALRSFADLRTGDIVVHEDHGIARFAGFETKTVAGVTRDYLYLEYQGDDRVFVPCDQLAKISRYVGAGGAHPPLSKLGGKAWDRLKARARRAAQELAGELLNLYAERRRRTGLSYPRRQRLAARVRGRLPVQRDGRPGRGDRARQDRHGVRAPDGPPDLRRRRVRQDRGRAARHVQGRRRRQAGAHARADDDPRPAALRHVRRAPEGLPVHDRARQPLPLGRRAEEGDRGLSDAAPSTSSSARTASSRATCARRTSA